MTYIKICIDVTSQLLPLLSWQSAVDLVSIFTNILYQSLLVRSS